MPRLSIDNQAVEVPAGATILDAARKLGVDVPALCFYAGHPPNNSCMVCLVKTGGRWVPSCATPAEEGMVVESETPEVRALRRTGLELLLSHHQGDCAAPCEHACPLHMNVPLMLRQVSEDDPLGAIATIRRDVALPSVLARVCGGMCEKACRRKEVDAPAAICLIQQCVADADLASSRPYLPPRRPAVGKRVAVLGAGPMGLTAAYHLLLAGYDCTLFDPHERPGGMLRYEIPPERLPRHILDREIALIERLGARFEMGARLQDEALRSRMNAGFSAILLADGPFETGVVERIQAGSVPVFVAGEIHRPHQQPARLMGDGKHAAECIDRHLRGDADAGAEAVFHFRAGRVPHEEIVALTVRAGSAPRVATPPSGSGLTFEQARTEALRCLHCDCGKRDGCVLRHYAAMLGAQPGRYRGQRRPIQRQAMTGGVIYEPGKCILCGICVRIATAAKEPLGLTFVGRGFDVRVAAPFDRAIEEGLTRTADECARACPTGALSSTPSHDF
ncbi:MAG: (2Fe-2S)-binding protein [Phycisphaerae bacterium]|jgi:ferredoxin